MRANMISATGQLDGFALAGTLTRYSGRGQAYVASLRTIIRTNDLSALDRAKLGEPGAHNMAAI
jgi:Bax protein